MLLGIIRFGQFRGNLHRQQYDHAEITRKKKPAEAGFLVL